MIERDTVQTSSELPNRAAHREGKGLFLIAIFKLTKGVLLLLVAVGALTLLHKDLAETATHWIDVLRVDPNNKYIHRLLVKLGLVNARKLEEISAGTFFYSALLLTEGTGLLLRKRWAEYFTVIATASFIPMEVYELLRRVTFTRAFLIALNVAIVWYLIANLLRARRADALRS
ncbi:MAG TPA: DUF2127 domain-containing protein [Blastocatellia bacterium]|nr:DUF2127 domain-containing protein [Blastocatellia bacterium]